MSTLAREPGRTARRPPARPGRDADDPYPAAHPVAVAIALQRSAGNRSVARLVGGGPSPATPVLHRQPAAAAATSEAELVSGWIAAGESRENVLADRVFFRRHPELAGTRLAPGTGPAAEWLEIRRALVRPALAGSAAPAPAAPTAAPGAPAAPAADPEPAGSVVGDALTAIGGAVDAAVTAGGDLLQDVADAGSDLLGLARDRGGAVGEAVLDLLGIGGDGGGVPGDLQQPEVVVDVPLEVEPGHERGDAYKSQRDNESAHVGGDASCSPTAFTMALIDLHGGDEEAVRARTVELIRERGGATTYEQTEELVIELLEVVDWATATSEAPRYFWSPATWAAWAAKTYGGHYYKDPNAQQYVASLYSATGGDAAETYGGVFTRDAWAPIVTALGEGAYATAEGAFTSSGHVVAIVDAGDDGVTINDPFGLWLRSAKGYGLPNGSTAGALDGAARAEFDRRAQRNPGLAQVYETHVADPASAAGYGAWGERNFYTWEDVADVKLGKWVSVLRAG